MLRPVSTLCLLLSLASSPALPQSSHLRLGRDMQIPRGQRANNLICLLCSAHIEGSINGNVVVFAGNAYVDSTLQKNVLDFGGRVTLASNARVGGRILVFGGHLHQDSNATISGQPLVIPPIVFLPILLVLAAFVAGLIFLLRLYFGPGTYPPLPRF